MKNAIFGISKPAGIAVLLGIIMILTFFAANAGAATVTISWRDNATDESGYRIERRLRKDAVTAYTQIGEVAANVETFDDATIATNTQYCYRVRGWNPVALSEYSNEACMMVTPSGVIVTFKSQ